MVKRLADVFAEASKLPAEEQEALAEFLAYELASDWRWAESSRISDKELAELTTDDMMELKR